MTDSVKFLPDILRWEDAVPHMYRDILGWATIGIGFLVRDADEALDLPLFNVTEGRPATPAEKTREFQRVMSCARGMRASGYRALKGPRLEMLPADIETRALKRLATEFLPGIRKLLPGFDAFPEAAQACLVDMAWNLGIGRPASPDHKATGLHGFPSLLAASNRGDWAEAAQHCHVATSRDERNAWRAMTFLDALPAPQ